jgi:hypothetical protein
MMDIMKSCSVFVGILLLMRCPQLPANPVSTVAQAPIVVTKSPERRISAADRYLYSFDIKSDAVGFSLLVNDIELLFFEGDSYSNTILLNDWMIPGENQFSINIFPAGKRNSDRSCSFILKRKSASSDEEYVLDTFDWSAATSNSKSGSFTETNFPATLVEKADTLPGNLPVDDQKEITEIVDQLRAAFSAKDINTVIALFENKNSDIASARFLQSAEYRKTMTDFYTDLMSKPGFSVKPLSRRIYAFSTALDRRFVKVMQGREGFPEAAITLYYRENGKLVSYEQNLYFAKISGSWIIIR